MKRFQAEDMKHLSYVSWPVASKDESLIGCVKYHADESTGNFLSSIYLIQDGQEKNISNARASESQPLFAEDGKSMYFLSDISGERQVWFRSLEDGEEKQITTLRHGVERFQFSELNHAIVFEATLWPEELEEEIAFTEMTSEEKAEWLQKMDMKPYVAEELVCKMDEWHGMRKGEYSHVGVLDLNSGNYEMVEAPRTELTYPTLSQDGNSVACFGYPYHDARGRMAELFVWNREKHELTQLTADIGLFADHYPIFTNDDQALVAAGFPPFEDASTLLMPYLVDVTSKKFRYLMDEKIAELELKPLAACRTEFGPMAYYMTLDESGEYLYYLSYADGYSNVCRVKMGVTSVTEKVVSGEFDVHAFWLMKSGKVLYNAATPTMPAELFLEEERLTRSNDWLNEYELAETKAYSVRSKDDEVDLPYFVVYPPNFDPSKKYPAILECKGGPESVNMRSFWHEFQAEAAQDFIVIYGNPRGSVGYGRAFNQGAICWGPRAMEDQISFVEDVIAKGFVDEKCIGVTGGSYGGYMTMKLIGRTDVFAAAVAQRALANPVTSYGTGDMGFVSSRPLPEGFTMKAYLESRARDNVISYIDKMKTPLLILHAAKDYRCGFEQAEQIFIAMKDRNPEVPVRLVRFPNENHALTRTGKLHYQMRHLKELVNWFCKYLKKEGSNHE
jgi:dipeptidyl aminopeptidase/acylaminoacyl peptidase